MVFFPRSSPIERRRPFKNQRGFFLTLPKGEREKGEGRWNDVQTGNIQSHRLWHVGLMIDAQKPITDTCRRHRMPRAFKTERKQSQNIQRRTCRGVASKRHLLAGHGAADPGWGAGWEEERRDTPLLRAGSPLPFGKRRNTSRAG